MRPPRAASARGFPSRSARFGSTRSARPLRARDLAARLPLLFAGRSAFDGGLGLHRRHAVGRDALEPLPLESRHFLLRNDRVSALGDKVLHSCSTLLLLEILEPQRAALLALAVRRRLGFNCNEISRLVVPGAARNFNKVSIEFTLVAGGAGSAVNEHLLNQNFTTPILNMGLPDTFLPHGRVPDMLASVGLDRDGIVAAVRDKLTRCKIHSQAV